MNAECSAGDIPSGYKQTEVGVIPEDWIPFELKDACERISVGLATSVTKYYRSAGVPIIRNLNIKNGFFDGKDILYICSEFAKANMTKVARAHDVLTVRTGANLGDTCVLPAVFDNCQTFTTLITTPKSGVLSPHFLCLHMSSFLGKKEIAKLQVGGGKVNLNTGDLKHYQLGVPPLPEQESIAEALFDADVLIESLEQLIAKKRQIKQGAMQELLTGKRRLPEFEMEKGYKQTEVGIIPEDWNLRPLGELVKFLDGMRRPVKDADRTKMRGSIPYYGASGIVDYVNDYIFDEDLILLGEDGENILSRACRLAFSISGETWVNNHAHVLRPNPDICIGFLTDYLESLNYERFNSGTAQPKLNKQTCFNILIALPPTKAEQEAIATILSDMDSEIAVLEEKLAKARQIKEGMMQELLTGRIRLI